MTHQITVCIPSIPPRRDDLSRAVTSVLGQTYPVTAINIAIDHQKLGAAATRNRAFMAAHTPWIAFLDDDDILYPQHLQRLVEHQQATGADVVFPWFDTEPAGNDPFPQFFGRQYDPQVPHMFPITTLVRRDLAYAVGGFPPGVPGEEAAGEDWQFWLKMRDRGAVFAHLPERTWLWRHTGRNTSGLPSRW